MIVVPSALKALNNWLVWRLVQAPGEPKPRKVPFYVSGAPRSGAQGGPADREALASYAAASAAVDSGHYTGLGFALMPEDNIVALDFDKCIKDGVLDPRIERLVSGTYAEVSPSGVGIRAFMRGTLRSRKDNAGEAERNSDGTRKDGLFDIEFFGNNGFVTITGNATADCEFMGLTDTVCDLTPEVHALYRQRFGSDGALVVQSDGDVDDLLGLSATLGWSMDTAREYLFDCDPGAGRETWLKALMAIHHELSGSPEALDLVDEWSGQSPKYGGRDDVVARWRSFGKGSGASVITGHWLLKWRGECLVHQKYAAVEDWKKEISQATDEATVREKVCPKITVDMRLDDLAREALAQLLVDTFKRMGTKYPIGSCRKMVAEKRQEKTGSTLPKWLQGWVYVTDDDKFYRMDSDEWLSMQGFNARFNRELPVDEDGERAADAVRFANEICQVPTVTRGLYLPWADSTFSVEGVQCVNTYRPSSTPVAVPELSLAGAQARAVVIKHLELLCGGRTEIVRTFINWMAHNVQHPGVKIRWAPLIKGVEGDGKTVLGNLMGAVMGNSNVRNVSPKVLGTDFTGWAEGSCIVILEEIKLTGHSRYDILNALKPFVTNSTIEVHRKGKDGHDAMNTTNYIAFTNYADALPLTETDRRWWIVFTPFADKTELAAAIGGGAVSVVLGTYFDTLFTLIQQNAGELRRWLLDHPIDADFQPNGSAPMTDEKAVMIGMSVSEEERAVQDILEKGGVGITRKIFASSYLSNEVLLGNNDINLATSAWSRLLGKMGYTRLPKKLKWRGKTEIIWVKGHVEIPLKKVRQVLDETVEGETESSQLDDLF